MPGASQRAGTGQTGDASLAVRVWGVKEECLRERRPPLSLFTWSARCRRDWGIVRPRAGLGGLGAMTNSNLEGRSKGATVIAEGGRLHITAMIRRRWPGPPARTTDAP